MISNDATLKNLTVSSGELSPEFDAFVTEYTVHVASDVTSITITGVANHNGAKVEGNVIDKTLNIGANTIPITVTAEDGVSTRIYTVTVIREQMTGTVETLCATSLQIYPNPFTGMVRITGTDVEITMGHAPLLQIINASGTIVHTQTITGTDETIHLEHLPAGVYIFRVEKDGNTKAVKVVKEQVLFAI